MRLLLRTLLTPIAALVLLMACVSFAVATSGGGYHPPKPAEDVYPCKPDQIGEHHDGKGDGEGGEDKSRTATLLSQYFTTTISSGGSHGGSEGGNHGGDDQCEPECPSGSSASSKTMTTTTYGGSHGGSEGGNDQCCPTGSSASSKTTTSGGSHSADDCKPECSSASSKKMTTGGSHGTDECKCPDGASASSRTSSITSGQDCERPECPEGTVHTSSASRTIDDCKPECPNGSLRSGGTCKPPEVSCGHGSYHSRSLPLAGTVNPGGVNTKGYFEYGTSNSLGSTTGAESLGNGRTATSLSASIDNLMPGAKYYYRVKAVSAGGAAVSPVQTFTVPLEAPAASTGGASSITKGSAAVGGTANPNGAATAAYIEYGESGGFGTKVASQSLGSGTDDKAMAAPLTGLSPNTTYSFRVVATNSVGTRTGATGSFTTLPNAPTAMTGAVSSTTKTGAKLVGTGSPGGTATTGYFEYGKTAALGSKSEIVMLGNGTALQSASTTLSGLTANTKYYFRFVTVNDGGTAAGATTSFTTAR
jgi:hypothetical protein